MQPASRAALKGKGCPRAALTSPQYHNKKQKVCIFHASKSNLSCPNHTLPPPPRRRELLVHSV